MATLQCNWCSAFSVVNTTHPLCTTCLKPVRKPRTQKGKGLAVLVAHQGSFYASVARALPFITIQKETDLPTSGYPYFARPAPSQPKHGYIDSRLVNSQEEATTLLAQVLEDDPGGELLLTAFIDASCSAIWTPTALTVGKGHDGATAGKNSAVIPLAGVVFDPLTPAIKDAVGSQWPYVELVLSTNAKYSYPVTMTQMRSGPKPAKLQGDFIPAPTLVKQVIAVDQDAFKDREWELLVEKLKGQEGAVVWHPGGTMLDHFSIHASLANIPIIFGQDAPQLGQVLEPTQDPITFDPEAMLDGLAAGDALSIDVCHDAGGSLSPASCLRAAATALHNATAMTGPSAFWLGVGAALMARLGMCALHGEARHFTQEGKSHSRDYVYGKVAQRSLSQHRNSVRRLLNIFRYGVWQSSGFGGPKWAACAASVINLLNAMGQLAKTPTHDTAEKLVQELNIAVNQAHNGGWWLNKFITQDVFTRIAQGSPMDIAAASQVFLQAHLLHQETSGSKLALYRLRLKSWKRLTVGPPRTIGATITYAPAQSKATIKVSTQLLKDRFKAMTATITTPVTPEQMKAEAYLVETEDGYRLELRGSADPQIIWTENSLQDAMLKQAKAA
jgi:hypothetical protein